MSYDRLNFQDLAKKLTSHIPHLIREILPSGKLEGHEYVALNPTRSDKNLGSFRTNIGNGKWKDFATGDSGGDFISLWAYVKNLSQIEAAKELQDRIGDQQRIVETKKITKNNTPIIPVPEDAPSFHAQRDASYYGWGSPDHIYDYRNEKGELLCYMLRWNAVKQKDGSLKKEFRPFLYCSFPNGKKAWQSIGFPGLRPLYNLHKLVQRSHAPVMMIEGEKAVDAGEQLFPDYVCTTTMHGAESPHKTDFTPLKGRHITIARDHDEAGLKYQNDLIKLCREAGAASIQILNMEVFSRYAIQEGRIVEHQRELPAKYDLGNTVEEGWTAKHFEELKDKGIEFIKEYVLFNQQDCLSFDSAKITEIEEPDPLYKSLGESPDFPLDALGEGLKNAVLGLEDILQTPREINATAVLSAIALVGQAHVNIQLPFGHIKPTSLYSVLIAESGERKTGVDAEVLRAVKKKQEEEVEDYYLNLKDYKIRHDIWKSAKSKILGEKTSNQTIDEIMSKIKSSIGDEPDPPIFPLYTTGEPTYEGIYNHFIDGTPYLGVFSTEGGQFISGHAMNDDNKVKTSAGLSLLWDGAPPDRVRKGDGSSILFGKRLSLSLMVQPGIDQKFLSDQLLQKQGILARCLTVYPKSKIGYRFYKELKKESRENISLFNARIEQILDLPLPFKKDKQGREKKGELEPNVIQMTENAKTAFNAFGDEVEESMQPQNRYEPIKGFACKMAEQASRVATLLAFYENSFEKYCGIYCINQYHFARAREIILFFAEEALRLIGKASIPQHLIDAERLLKWLKDSWTENNISATDVSKNLNWVSTADNARQLLATLEKHKWLIKLNDGAIIKGQKRREAWKIRRNYLTVGEKTQTIGVLSVQKIRINTSTVGTIGTVGGFLGDEKNNLNNSLKNKNNIIKNLDKLYINDGFIENEILNPLTPTDSTDCADSCLKISVHDSDSSPTVDTKTPTVCKNSEKRLREEVPTSLQPFQVSVSINTDSNIEWE